MAETTNDNWGLCHPTHATAIHISNLIPRTVHSYPFHVSSIACQWQPQHTQHQLQQNCSLCVIANVVWSVLCPAQVQLIVINICAKLVTLLPLFPPLPHLPTPSAMPHHSISRPVWYTVPAQPPTARPPHSRPWWLISSDTTTEGQTYTAAAVSPSVQCDVWVGYLIT